MNLVDAIGQTHHPVSSSQTPRIVSLVPSITELLCDLGLAHGLVGRTGFPLDNLALYRLLGGIFCVDVEAERLCAAFEHEYAALSVLPRCPPKTMLYCIWKDPWMTVSRDTYIAQMLVQLGWQQWVATDSGEAARRYPKFNWSQEVVDAIDEVLLSSEPYRFAEAHVDALEQQIGKPVQLVDGEMMSWYGSRAISGLRYLRQLARSAGNA
jgi:ABC-type Fe3+-hydroxamate transport system substrate-binding protein